jgi:hypothetical protein
VCWRVQAEAAAAVKAAAEAAAADGRRRRQLLALRMHSDALRVSHERHIPKATYQLVSNHKTVLCRVATRAEQPDPVAPSRAVQPQQTRGEREGLRRVQHAVEHGVHVVHQRTALHYPAIVVRCYYSKSL